MSNVYVVVTITNEIIEVDSSYDRCETVVSHYCGYNDTPYEDAPKIIPIKHLSPALKKVAMSRCWYVGSRWCHTTNPTPFSSQEEAFAECRKLNDSCEEVKAGNSPYFTTRSIDLAAI